MYVNSKLSALSPFGVMFRAAYSPWEMKTFWVLVNTVEDEASHVSNAFSKLDTSLFFAIIDELMEENGLITVHRAEELGSDLHMNTESTKSGLHKLERLKWLKILRQRDEGPCVTFGARSMTELPRVRAFVRNYHRDGNDVGIIPNNTLGSQEQGATQTNDRAKLKAEEGEEQDEQDKVIVSGRRRNRSSLPRLSQDGGNIDADVEMRDGDEDEIRPVRPRRSTRRRQR